MSIYTFGAKQLRHGAKRRRHKAKWPRKWGETTKDVGRNDHGAKWLVTGFKTCTAFTASPNFQCSTEKERPSWCRYVSSFILFLNCDWCWKMLYTTKFKPRLFKSNKYTVHGTWLLQAEESILNLHENFLQYANLLSHDRSERMKARPNVNTCIIKWGNLKLQALSVVSALSVDISFNPFTTTYLTS